MKIAILGAGAIGGLLASKLIISGLSVTVIDRGEHLDKIKLNGIRLIQPDLSEISVRPERAVSNCEEAGQHDLIFLCVKANQLEEMDLELPFLFHEKSIVVTMQNGLPWWYFEKLEGQLSHYQFKSIDTEQKLKKCINSNMILGSVAFPSGEVIAPGIIKHIEGYRFPIGELDGTISDRALIVSHLLNMAGFKSSVLRDIRSQIWLKLWGNLSFNPISALTHTTLVKLCEDKDTRELVAEMMSEAKQIGEKLGVRFRISIQHRIEAGASTGEHKTSTLQDIENGRRVEVNALLGSVLELGEILNIKTPNIRMAFTLLKLLDLNLKTQNSKIQLQKL